MRGFIAERGCRWLDSIIEEIAIREQREPDCPELAELRQALAEYRAACARSEQSQQPPASEQE